MNKRNFLINSNFIHKREICKNQKFTFKNNENELNKTNSVAYLKKFNNNHNIEFEKFTEIEKNKHFENNLKCTYLELKGIFFEKKNT